MDIKARLQSFVGGEQVSGIATGLLIMAVMVACVYAAAIATDPDARLSTAVVATTADNGTAATGASSGEAGAE